MSAPLDEKAVVTAFIHKLGREGDQVGFQALLSDDVVAETPSEPDPERPERFVGPDAVVDRYFSRRSDMSSLDFKDVQVYAADQPGALVVTCRSDGVYTDGRTYSNRYAWVFRVEGSKIVEVQEFFDPKPVNKARGEA
jgi:ketosteroid isomerase-like protein